jgi:DNA-binding MarR family transcriptional regulator
MDAVFLAIKQAHLAANVFSRRCLKGFGLTPARFDLLNLLSNECVDGDWTQSGVRRVLGVARSTLSEMLDVLEGLGWIERSVNDHDGRTWFVSLTAKGLELVMRAYVALVGSGDVTVRVDAFMADDDPEEDPFPCAYETIGVARALARRFGRGGGEIYTYDPDDYVGWLVDESLGSDLVSWVQ